MRMSRIADSSTAVIPAQAGTQGRAIPARGPWCNIPLVSRLRGNDAAVWGSVL